MKQKTLNDFVEKALKEETTDMLVISRSEGNQISAITFGDDIRLGEALLNVIESNKDPKHSEILLKLLLNTVYTMAVTDSKCANIVRSMANDIVEKTRRNEYKNIQLFTKNQIPS